MPNVITTYTNQRTIKINKAVCDKNHLYSTNNLQALDNAVQTLTSIGGMKLWLYLAKNQKGHLRALSSKDFCEWANCSIKSYNTGFADLKDNGFLVEDEERKNYYQFYEWGNRMIIADEKEEKPAPKDGEFDF